MSAAAAPAPAEQPTTPADMSLYEAMKSYGNDTSGGMFHAADPAKLAKFEEMLASGHRGEEELKQAKLQPKNLSDEAEEADSWGSGEMEEIADACNAKSSHWSKVLALYAD